MVDKYNNIIGKFVRGPLSANQILEFSRYGINAVRIFLYIRMQEGKLVSSGELKAKEHTWIALDNKNTEAMVGLHKSHKWDKLRTLEQKGLIELKTEKGKAPRAKIIVPSLH
jgi:phosphoribosylanthranilate isomerase|tara:strand:+ start:674 stop:1009 length:336 start_codon:yes stop_codon:yes gene_type:complete